MTALPQDESLNLRDADLALRESLTQPPIPLREAIGLYLLCLGLMLSVGLLLQAIDLRIGLIVTEGGLILLPTLYFIQKNRRSFRQVLGLKRVSPQVLLLVLLITIPFRICSFLVSALVQTLFPVPDFIVRSLQRTYAELMFPSNTSELALTVLGIVFLAAICEEALFRGFILNTLLKRKSAWSAITITALGFSLYHLDPWAMPEVAIIGIFLGWLVVRTGSIFPAVLAHGTFNFIGIILFPKVFGVTTIEAFFRISFPPYVYLMALALLVVLLYAFVRLTDTRAIRGSEEGNV
ncbi:MAG: type II CAAX prenyl endopeptidase Rce1 family protein [bacterium]